MGGLPCKEKIILNGGDIGHFAEQLCYRIQAPGTVEINEDDGYAIIKHMNAAEDELCKAKAIWLKTQGYDGPLPHALSW